MTKAFNQYHLNLILTVIFILGVGASLYFIYSLPYNLRLADGYQSELLNLYMVIGATALFGLLALIWALRYKKEVIVFRDRIIDTSKAKREAAEHAGKTTISLESIKAVIAESTTEDELLEKAIQAIGKQLQAGQGAIYRVTQEDGHHHSGSKQKRKVELRAGYSLNFGESAVISYEFGEGLIGQVAATGNTLFIDEVPQGYITILSGLGSASPRYLLIAPVKKNEAILGVLEIASFTKVTDDERKFIEESAQLIADKLSSQP